MKGITYYKGFFYTNFVHILFLLIFYFINLFYLFFHFVISTVNKAVF